MFWNRLRICILLLGSAVTMTFCGEPTTSVVKEAPPVIEQAPVGDPVAVIDTDHGQIVVALLRDIAPRTVEHFIELAELGFYNRTTFHRVIAGDMIQGGSPTSRDNDPYNDGQGTTGSTIPAETSDHEFDRGTLAMAHSPGNRDSGSCQFFIVLRRIPEWDGEYTAFGKVLEGIEIVEKISNAPLSKSTHPTLKQRPAGKQLIHSIQIDYRDLE